MRAFLDGYGADQSLKLNFSLPVFAISLPQLGKNPVRPEPIGWQFLTMDGNGVVVGEVPNQPDSVNGEIETSLTRGTAVDQAWQAYGFVKEHPDLLNQAFELRRLRISPLWIDAFWLKAMPADDVLGPNDRVYTFLTFDDRLRSKLLPAPDFLKIVMHVAAEAYAAKLPGPGN